MDQVNVGTQSSDLVVGVVILFWAAVCPMWSISRNTAAPEMELSLRLASPSLNNVLLSALTGFLLLALLPAPSSCHPTAVQNISESPREINNEEILV